MSKYSAKQLFTRKNNIFFIECLNPSGLLARLALNRDLLILRFLQV